MSLRRNLTALLALASLALPALASGPPFDPTLFAEMRWRMIGPHRGGRTKAATGVPGRPGLFYIGAVNGGVFRSDDYGRTWTPVFDDQPTGSIGALAVAPSNPDIVYVGSGEGLQRPDLSTGDGVYKSSDGGKTWAHLGLRDGQQIPQIVVHPGNPDRLYVAVLGHPYGPNPERGVFRSSDGGKTFERVLYRDDDTGGVDVALDPRDPDTVYAALWESRQAPWENGEFTGPGSGLHKSTDGGQTWHALTKGLPGPAEGLGRIGVTVAPGDSRRLYATVQVGEDGWVYRSDDAGESWRRAGEDPRVAGRPDDFAEIKVDPVNPDVVYSASVVTWKSTDGGASWAALRGAPGGDDYHRIWIDPGNPKVILLAGDQGAIVSVNGGQTWSSWYNQATAQIFHVNTDNAFPYRVCGGQQESGSVCISSRGDDGQITFREWHPVGAEEYGYAVPDPLNPDLVYGGKLTRYDRRTGQVQNVAPRPLRGASGYRVVRTAPVVFSPLDPRVLYFASNQVWKTTSGGRSWAAISPDLTRANWTVPKNAGKYAASDAARPKQRGVVYTLAPSPLSLGLLWAGTDDGLIHLTRNGGQTWTDVTPPDLGPWAKVSLMDASHFDPGEAYAAVNTLRLDDLRPHIYRTLDFGKTWVEVTHGLPDGGIVNVVREDPRRRGLLFAGTEQAVYVSFDDGEHWQSLRLNMPATSIRDLVIKDDDLVVGTHGRSFWVLDDITPLRQITPAVADAESHLFDPQTALRVRWNQNTDTPLPPEEPAGQNPPDGAILDYWLKADAGGPVSLEIQDGAGKLVRRFASTDVPEPPVPGRNIPDYWIRPPQTLSARAGMHRFVWDLRYPPPAVLRFGYPIAAIAQNTPREPRGPWVPPGTYRVRLTVGGKTHQQRLVVKMDPRVKERPETLVQQLRLSTTLTEALRQNADAVAGLRALRAALGKRQATGLLADAITALDRKAAALESGDGDNLARLNGQLASLLDALQDADTAPTAALLAAIAERQQAQVPLLTRWRELRSGELMELHRQLKEAGVEAPVLD